MILWTSSMSTEPQPSSHLIPFVLMSQYQGGTEGVATGLLNQGLPSTMLLLTGSQRRDVRYKVLRVGKTEQ